MKIIYVEDDPINALVVERFLKDYSCRIFSCGEDALQFCQKEVVDLVLLDINLGMDCMDGVQVLKELRKNPLYTDKPIIALTAYALPEDQDRFLREGFDYYLSKPVNREKLIRTIHSFLGQLSPSAK